MERDVDVEDVRKKASAFLRDILHQSATKSPEEIAQNITDLAFQSANPVRDLFVTANSNQSNSPPRSPKSRSSKILRLGRRENKSTSQASKTPVQTQPSIGQKNVATKSSNKERSEEKQAVTNLPSQLVEKSGNESGAVPYVCIICNWDMSSKGVCKRHLDEQHVSPKLFRCEKCGNDYVTKAEAKKHCNSCGVGIFTWTTVKSQPRKVYASEFTEEWFSSKSTYLEHLLKLSKRGAVRPPPSLHCKLRALLSHPNLRQRVDDISQTLYGSITAWRSMRWSEEQLQSAIEHLEEAVIVHDNGVIEFGDIGPQKALSIQLFLQHLLCGGILAESSRNIPLQQGVEAMNLQTQDCGVPFATTMNPPTDQVLAGPTYVPPSPMDCLPDSIMSPQTGSIGNADAATFTSPDLKVKRHLSDDSRFYEPTREPPGRPIEPIHFQSPFNARTDDAQVASMSDMPATILPYRLHNGSVVTHENVEVDVAQMQPYAAPGLVNVPYSAAASETTLVSAYREPELQESTPAGYSLWLSGQSINFIPTFSDASKGMLPYLSYPYPSETSLRTPSVATEQTCVGVSEQDSKLETLASLTTYTPAFGSYPVESTDQQQFQGINR